MGKAPQPGTLALLTAKTDIHYLAITFIAFPAETEETVGFAGRRDGKRGKKSNAMRSSYSRIAQRRDLNESNLAKLARELGGDIIFLHAGQGADWVLLTPGGIIVVEVKDGQKPPSQRRLTSDELKLQQLCQRLHCPHAVVTNEAELRKLFHA